MVGTHFGSDPLQSVINSIISVSIEALRLIVFIARSPYVIVKVGNYNFIHASISVLHFTPSRNSSVNTTTRTKRTRRKEELLVFFGVEIPLQIMRVVRFRHCIRIKRIILYCEIKPFAATESLFSLDKYWFKCSQNLK